MSHCCITVTSTQRQVIIIAFTFVVFALNHLEPPYQELLVSLLWNTPNEQQQFGNIWCFLWNTAQSLLTARFKNNVLHNIPINGGAMFCRECDLLLNKEVKLWPTAEDRVTATSVDSVELPPQNSLVLPGLFTFINPFAVCILCSPEGHLFSFEI